MTVIEHVFSAQNELGEGPLWHPDEQVLYWIDILRGDLYRLDPATGAVQQWNVGEAVGCIGLRAGGGLVMGNVTSIGIWTPEAGRKVIVQLEQAQVGDRFNDGAVDPAGRFWVGSMTTAHAGFLYRVDADHSLHTMATGVHIGNGIGWSPDHRTMYFTDSPLYTIFAYDYDRATGAIENRREFVNTRAENAGTPDGLTVDRDGCIWSARWDGWKIVCYDPDGTVMQEVPMPVQRPTSCIFGGPDLNVLYITSARLDLTAQDLASQPQAGDLFCMVVDVAGPAEPFFAG